jgi:hypothetical protein
MFGFPMSLHHHPIVRAAVLMASVAMTPFHAEALTPMRQFSITRFLGNRAPNSNGTRRGRPRKFGRPSRAVTLTLPEDVIATLQAIDADLSRAVVRAMEPLTPREPASPAELASYGNRSVILVPPSKVLRERTGVELIPLSDGRALISMDDRHSLPELELQLTDALADTALDAESRQLFGALVGILRAARQDDGVEVRQQQIIILQRRAIAESA